MESVAKRLLHRPRPQAELAQTRTGIETHTTPRELDSRYCGHRRLAGKHTGNELIRVRHRESDPVRDAPGRFWDTSDSREQGKNRTDRQVLMAEQIAPAEAAVLHCSLHPERDVSNVE